MNIGIIVHSQSGTTLKFAGLIAKKLIEQKHAVDIIELKTDVPASGSVRQSNKYSILNIPDCTKYDALLVGGPVWAFAASPVIIKCIEKLQGISGKKILPFVTMSFPFPSMGGKQAIKLMSETSSSLGAVVMPGKIISKLFHDYQLDMEKAAAEIPVYF